MPQARNKKRLRRVLGIWNYQMVALEMLQKENYVVAIWAKFEITGKNVYV
jgi:hypothetical protein